MKKQRDHGHDDELSDDSYESDRSNDSDSLRRVRASSARPETRRTRPRREPGTPSPLRRSQRVSERHRDATRPRSASATTSGDTSSASLLRVRADTAIHPFNGITTPISIGSMPLCPIDENVTTMRCDRVVGAETYVSMGSGVKLPISQSCARYIDADSYSWFAGTVPNMWRIAPPMVTNDASVTTHIVGMPRTNVVVDPMFLGVVVVDVFGGHWPVFGSPRARQKCNLLIINGPVVATGDDSRSLSAAIDAVVARLGPHMNIVPDRLIMNLSTSEARTNVIVVPPVRNVEINVAVVPHSNHKQQFIYVPQSEQFKCDMTITLRCFAIPSHPIECDFVLCAPSNRLNVTALGGCRTVCVREHPLEARVRRMPDAVPVRVPSFVQLLRDVDIDTEISVRPGTNILHIKTPKCAAGTHMKLVGDCSTLQAVIVDPVPAKWYQQPQDYDKTAFMMDRIVSPNRRIETLRFFVLKTQDYRTTLFARGTTAPNDYDLVRRAVSGIHPVTLLSMLLDIPGKLWD